MKKIGAYEAKTNLSKILDEVATGKEFAITKHGVPIALLIPAGESAKRPTQEVIEEILEFRKKKILSKKQIREMITEGRQ